MTLLRNYHLISHNYDSLSWNYGLVSQVWDDILKLWLCIIWLSILKLQLGISLLWLGVLKLWLSHYDTIEKLSLGISLWLYLEIMTLSLEYLIIMKWHLKIMALHMSSLWNYWEIISRYLIVTYYLKMIILFLISMN